MNLPTYDTGEVCIPNISPKERQKHLRSGVFGLVVTLIMLAVLLAIGAPIWWRLFLYPMFAGSATGFFQWRDKT